MKVILLKWINVLDRVGKDKPMNKAFLRFYSRLLEANWTKPGDILNTFNDADIVKCKKGNRIVFNIGGNKYRLVCGYRFGRKCIFLFVKFVGTHKEYDNIDVCTIEMYKK